MKVPLRQIMRVVWVGTIIVIMDQHVLDNQYNFETSDCTSWVFQEFEIRKLNQHIHYKYVIKSNETDVNLLMIIDSVCSAISGGSFSFIEDIQTNIGCCTTSQEKENQIEKVEHGSNGVGALDFEIIPVIDNRVDTGHTFSRKK